MDKKTIHQLVNLLQGVNQSEWSRIKQQVDMAFNQEVAKVGLGDSELLKQNLEVEFNFRRFGEEKVTRNTKNINVKDIEFVVRIENLEEFQRLTNKAATLSGQLGETLQRIESFKISTTVSQD